MKVYMVRWCFWKKDEDNVYTKIFDSEERAWTFCLSNFGLNFKRKSIQKIEGFLAKWINDKRWVTLTEHRLYRERKDRDIKLP